MDLEFRLAYCITVHFKCIIKKGVVIHLSRRKNKESNAFPCKFQKHLKRLSFGYQIFVDQTYLWRSRASSKSSKSIIIYKKEWIFYMIFDNTHLKI